MAKWNFFVTNNSLIKELDTSNNDVKPQSQSFVSATLDLQGNKIVFKESGAYKTALLFTEIGTIDGNTPTDIQDAYNKIIAIIPEPTPPGASNLQQVTDNGNTTTNAISTGNIVSTDVNNGEPTFVGIFDGSETSGNENIPLIVFEDSDINKNITIKTPLEGFTENLEFELPSTSGKLALEIAKQYKFLLSQSGGDDPQTATSGTLTKGVTYEIVAFETGDDFTLSGAPNNDVGTKWIANGTSPTWSNGSEIGWNGGAPVLGLNFGIDFSGTWFERFDFGSCYWKSNGLFTIDKVFFPVQHGFCEWLPETQTYFGIHHDNINQITILTSDVSGVYLDGLLNNTSIVAEIHN